MAPPLLLGGETFLMDEQTALPWHDQDILWQNCPPLAEREQFALRKQGRRVISDSLNLRLNIIQLIVALLHLNVRNFVKKL